MIFGLIYKIPERNIYGVQVFYMENHVSFEAMIKELKKADMNQNKDKV